MNRSILITSKHDDIHALHVLVFNHGRIREYYPVKSSRFVLRLANGKNMFGTGATNHSVKKDTETIKFPEDSYLMVNIDVCDHARKSWVPVPSGEVRGIPREPYTPLEDDMHLFCDDCWFDFGVVKTLERIGDLEDIEPNF